MTGRPISGGPLDSLRSGLRSEYPMLRAAAEKTIKRSLRAESWAQVARNLGVNPRSFERFLRDFPEVREWRDDLSKVA